MKVTVKKRNLQEAAAKASKIITKSILPVAQCMHMEVKGEKIIFSAFSNDMTIHTLCEDVIADADFECVFTADTFMRFLSKVKTEKIDMTLLKEGRAEVLHLKGGQAKMKLQCTAVKQWPKRKELEEPTFSQETDFLFPAIAQCKHALSQNEGDPLMSSFCISRKGEDWKITALDGKRVSIRGTNFEDPDIDILLNGANLITLHSIFASSVRLEMKDEEVRISDECTEVYLRTIFGKYFKMSTILNSSTPLYFKVKAEELQDALDLVAGLSTSGDKKIKLTIANDMLLIEANDIIGNELKCNVSVETNCNKEFVAGMNPSYLLDAIKSIDQEEIRIEMQDQYHPFIIRGEEFFEILMPIKIS